MFQRALKSISTKQLGCQPKFPFRDSSFPDPESTIIISIFLRRLRAGCEKHPLSAVRETTGKRESANLIPFSCICVKEPDLLSGCFLNETPRAIASPIYSLFALGRGQGELFPNCTQRKLLFMRPHWLDAAWVKERNLCNTKLNHAKVDAAVAVPCAP